MKDQALGGLFPLARLYTALRDSPAGHVDVDWGNPFAARFKEAMDDDFNTPEACAGHEQAAAALIDLYREEPALIARDAHRMPSAYSFAPKLAKASKL